MKIKNSYVRLSSHCVWPGHPTLRIAVVIKEWQDAGCVGDKVPLCDLCSKAADVDEATFDVGAWVLATGNANLTKVYRHLARIERFMSLGIHDAVKLCRLTGSAEGEFVARWIERRGVTGSLHTVLGVST